MKAPDTRYEVYRQGDVLVMRVDAVPAEAEQVPWDGRIVLAYGEVTGHAHAISTAQAKMYSTQGERYLAVPAEAKLVHEEHATITLPAGFYRVIQQREYVPEAAPRDVAD